MLRQNSNEIKWRPLESSTDATALQNRSDTINSLYAEAAALNYQIVATNDLSGDPKYVLYVEATADKAEYVKGLLEAMDQA